MSREVRLKGLVAQGALYSRVIQLMEEHGGPQVQDPAILDHVTPVHLRDTRKEIAQSYDMSLELVKNIQGQAAVRHGFGKLH